MYKRVMASVLMVLLASAGLFAVSLDWKISSPGTKLVSYQFGGTEGSWTIVEQEGLEEISLQGGSDKDLCVRASNDGSVWSEIARYRYDAKSETAVKVSVEGYDSIWRVESKDTSFVRYQFESCDGEWIVVEQNGADVVEIDGDTGRDMYFQCSYDGKNWSEVSGFRFNTGTGKAAKIFPAVDMNPSSIVASVSIAPYTWTKFNFKSDLFNDLSSKYGLSVKADVKYQKGFWFVGGSMAFDLTQYADVSSSMLGFGFDAFAGVTKSFGAVAAFVEAGAGVQIMKLESTNVVPEGFVGVGAEYSFTDSLAAKAEVLCKMTHLGHADEVFVANTFGVDAYVGVSKKF